MSASGELYNIFTTNFIFVYHNDNKRKIFSHIFLFKLQSTARHAFHRFLAGFFKENFGYATL